MINQCLKEDQVSLFLVAVHRAHPGLLFHMDIQGPGSLHFLTLHSLGHCPPCHRQTHHRPVVVLTPEKGKERVIQEPHSLSA